MLSILALMVCAAFSSAQVRPHWYDRAVIYETYPRSFQDSDGDGIGDLNGITSRLDYIKQLGVDTVWITPFFPSPNVDFGYDVADYTNVAPEYGTLQDWDRLVAEAKKRGIRILVDFVLNHTSDQHPWFKESRSSRDNPKRDWNVWRSGPRPGEPHTHWTSIFGGYTWTCYDKTRQWYYHIFAPQQPNVNWRNPELKKAMFDVVRFWLSTVRADFGWMRHPTCSKIPRSQMTRIRRKRADLPHWSVQLGASGKYQVLREMRRVLDNYPGDPVLLGEPPTATIQDLANVYGQNRDEIQLPMDFLFGNLTVLDAQLFKKQVDAAQTQLGGQTPVFFFSSHDHPRQWSTFGDGKNNDQIAKLTAALTLAQRGCVLLYYGEEIGMETMPAGELRLVATGPKRPRADDRDGARTPMQWDAGVNAGFSNAAPWLPVESAYKRYNVQTEKEQPDSLYSWYANLIKFRHQNSALRDGSYVPLESGNRDVFTFGRITKGNESVLVVLNTSAREQQVSIPGMPGDWPTSGKVLMASPPANAPTSRSFKVAPYGVLIAEVR